MKSYSLNSRLSACVAVAAMAWTLPGAQSQATPPPNMVNLADLGEIPYMPGGIPASGPIQGPQEDRDYIKFANTFWDAIDTGNTAGLNQYKWSAPDIVALETGFPGTTVDVWGGGLELFEALYQHRLQPFNRSGAKSIRNLIEKDPQVALLFKHYTLYHQVITVGSWDATAHGLHREMLIEALTAGQAASVRGVPLISGNQLVSDRLEMEVPDKWFGKVPGPIPGPKDGARGGDEVSDEEAIAQAQACIESMLCNLKSMPWKADDYGFLGFGGTPGFDCDDFADALGAGISKNKPGVTACTVRMTWKKGKGKSAHQITKIKAGGKYWLLDGQVGAASGPHDDGTPMDGEPVLSGPGGSYPHEPGSVRTGQSGRELGERPWVEPAPWTENPDMVKCFETSTGLSAECYTH